MKPWLRALGFLVLVPVSVLLWGYTDMRLWTWFAVPLGAPAIGMMHAAGLGLLGWALSSSKKIDPTEPDSHTVGRATLLPLWLLLFGKILHAIAGLP